MRQLAATVMITYDVHSNEDLEEGTPPDEGWYVNIEPVKGPAVDYPSFYGPGLTSLDEAVSWVKKWAKDRRFETSPIIIQLNIIREAPDA